MDSYYYVEMFKAVYDVTIPTILDKSMWPKVQHGFFMHPPLLKSAIGRRRQNRYVQRSGRGVLKEERVGISVQSIYNMGIIGTLVTMVAQMTKRQCSQIGNIEPKLCNYI